MRYRGYVYDRETALYYLQSRYYYPELGRFINADAFASTGQGIIGNNMFAYCNNNPVNYVDITGNVATAIIVGAAIAGGLWGLLSYLSSTENPTIGVALLAIILGAGSAAVGVCAGLTHGAAKLSLCALSGAISTVPVYMDAVASGSGKDDVAVACLTAFGSGATVTYLGSYIDVKLFQPFDEAAAMSNITILSGSAASLLSFPFDFVIRPIIACLTFAPEYTPTKFDRMRKSTGIGISQYCVVQLTAQGGTNV